MANGNLVYTAAEHNLNDDFPFMVSHWVHNASSAVPMHSHEFVEIVFIIDGSARHIFKGPVSGSYISELSKGDIFIINPGEEHTFEVAEDEKIEVINLLFYPNIIDWNLFTNNEDVEWLDFFYVQPFLPADIRFNNVLNLCKHEAEIYRQLVGNIEMEYRQKHASYRLVIKLIMTQIIILLSRKLSNLKQSYINQNCGDDDRIANVQRILGFLERHYAEEITMEQLAKICLCSVRQLSRLFKMYTGDTVVNYLIKLRVEKSKHLLRTTNQKITSICSMVGFNDISYFNKSFKKLTGENPKDFRKKYMRNGGNGVAFIGTLDMAKKRAEL